MRSVVAANNRHMADFTFELLGVRHSIFSARERALLGERLLREAARLLLVEDATPPAKSMR